MTQQIGLKISMRADSTTLNQSSVEEKKESGFEMRDEEVVSIYAPNGSTVCVAWIQVGLPRQS